jgi:hypothetical protein
MAAGHPCEEGEDAGTDGRREGRGDGGLGRRPRRRRDPRRLGRRVRHQRAYGGARAAGARPRAAAPPKPASDLCRDHGLRARRPGGRSGCLRHRCLLVALGNRLDAHHARELSPVPARGDGGPRGGRVGGGGDLGGPLRPGEERPGAARLDLSVAPGDLHAELRPERLASLRHRASGGGPAHHDQPGHQLLSRQRREVVLARRSRRGAPLGAARPGRRPPRVDRGPALREARGPGGQRGRAHRAARRDLRAGDPGGVGEALRRGAGRLVGARADARRGRGRSAGPRERSAGGRARRSDDHDVPGHPGRLRRDPLGSARP